MGAHVNPGPAVGLKNFAPSNATLLHHGHHMHHPHLMHGHHNLAMSNGSTTSSQSSSLGGLGAGGLGGGDPLLRNHRAAHSLHQHHHHHHRRNPSGAPPLDEGELDTDCGEQGVLSSDETNYGQEQQAGEGYREANELTINADTVVNGGQSAAHRRNLYSANSIGRANRLSAASNSQHHAHHHRAANGSTGSSQHQRLVSSSTPSTSTRSSRASPPSDDQSLEQLAYGNNWHPNPLGAQAGGQRDSSSSSNSNNNNNSAGSGASILGGGRANMRLG